MGQIGNNSQCECYHRGKYEDGAEQKRLYMAASIARNIHNTVSNKRNNPPNKKYTAQRYKYQMWAVHYVAASDGAAGFEHVLPDVLEQPRLTSFGVGFNRDAFDWNALVACLDDCLHAVAELSDDVDTHQRLL